MSTASQVINHQCASSSLPSHQMSANSNSVATAAAATKKSSTSSSSASVSVVEKSTNVVNQNAAAATAAESTTCTNSNGCIDPNFEYKGYYKFGRILGKGSFGTVIECVRKCDEKPIALKLFKYNAIHKWIAESVVADDLDSSLLGKSEFFSASVQRSTSSQSSLSDESDEQERMLPSEVACLIRASRIDGVVKILDYIPESNLECENAESGCHDGAAVAKSDQASDVNLDDDDAIIGIVLERDPNEICLFEYLLRNKYLDEDEARGIMKQLIKICINLLHAGVLHGDLKPENILINPRTKRITVIDFGSAQLIDPTNSNGRVSSNHQQNSSHHHNHHSNGTTHHSTNGHGGHHSSHHQQSSHHHGSNQIKCKHQSVCPSIAKPFRSFRGTNLYKPPEYILHHCFYPRSSTVWSFGIIVYDMVCGNFPFDKDSDILTHQDKDIEFSRKDLSDSFKDLVRKCLSFYVCDRINIEKILNHPWLNQQD